MRSVLVGFGGAVLVIAALLAPGARAPLEATTKVKVTASSSSTCSRKTAPKGTIVFTLVNKGKLPHDFKIAGRTAKIGPGKTAT